MSAVKYCWLYFVVLDTLSYVAKGANGWGAPDSRLSSRLYIYHTLSYFANGCGALPPDLDRLYCRVCCLQMSRNKAAEQAAVILAPSFTDVLGYIYLIKYKYKYKYKKKTINLRRSREKASSPVTLAPIFTDVLRQNISLPFAVQLMGEDGMRLWSYWLSANLRFFGGTYCRT